MFECRVLMDALMDAGIVARDEKDSKRWLDAARIISAFGLTFFLDGASNDDFHVSQAASTKSTYTVQMLHHRDFQHETLTFVCESCRQKLKGK